MKGLSFIKDHGAWEIRNGAEVNVWKDSWIPEIKTTLSKPDLIQLNDINMVNSLFNIGTKDWNHDILDLCFDSAAKNRILQIRIPSYDVDNFKWSLNKNGIFSVKSLYNSLIPADPNTNISLWSSIWSLNVYPKIKIKIFIWKCLHDILPLGGRIFVVLPSIDPTCYLCKEKVESVYHLFLECNFARVVWFSLPCGILIHSIPFQSFRDWFLNGDNMMSQWNELHFSWKDYSAFVVWFIWKARCEKLFENIDPDPIRTVSQIQQVVLFYQDKQEHSMPTSRTSNTHHQVSGGSPNLNMDHSRWIISFKCDFKSHDTNSGIGISLTNMAGICCGSRALSVSCMNQEQGSLLAALEAVKWCKSNKNSFSE
ncbi:Reverse transcriptase zinc-binding domain [Macleaya cordata]|uniref:Reverse transcriptase zinc-binding domain n=1 Tax=Macleaya cordata TaxID=56857 RepID=A0A200R2A0_MACCD|nr:Reverse transcriptase zinc-binding domain [Macleaya cordata]